jgi:oligopeptide/dipeptide ABC transporter ATP-binding protein
VSDASTAAERRATGGTSEPVLAVRDVRAWYGTMGDPVRAVDGVSLDLRAGETVGLVGESGCGKSTLGRAIMGLLPEGAAVAGEVRYRGRDLVGLSQTEMRSLRGPDLGLVFQEPMTRLDPLVTIESHFLETLHAHEPGTSEDEMRRRSLESLAGMGIPPTRFKQYPHEFSGGMRQRIMIALALVLNPKVVIADEPTTALDVIVEAQILQILADLRRNFDAALLLITHNLGIVAETCDRLAVMYAGQIVEEGDAREVFTDPAHPYTRLHYIPGAPPSLVTPPDACRFHPRCPNAMRVCAAKDPIEMPPGAEQGSPRAGRVLCWLHGPADEIPAGGEEPLEREEFAVAEEA